MILVQQRGEIYNIKFSYNQEIIDLVKNVPGRKWEPEIKIWTIPKDKLGFLIAQFKGTKYENELKIESQEYLNQNEPLGTTNNIPKDVDLSDVNFRIAEGMAPFEHQWDTFRYYKSRRASGIENGFLLADEPGCISGDAFVRIRREGTTWTRECRLSNLYKLWIKGDNQFRIKTMCNGRFVYLPVGNVIDKGVRPVVRLTTDNTSIVCTPDHQIYTPNGWVPAENLRPGDIVYTNGDPVCPKCGSKQNIVTYQYSKFKGLCRKCMYASREGCKFKGDEIYRELDHNGYVRLKGKPTREWPLYKYSNGEGIYEHHQVWYEHTGYIIDTSKEAIHHKDHDKTNNSFDNLELLSHSAHGKIHEDTSTAHLPQNQDVDFYYVHGVKTWCVPHPATVVSVEFCGSDHVYDVTIDHPDIHNFIADDLIVHNCGKTAQIANLAIYKKETQMSQHCLIIVCVNSAKYNWRDDILKHTQGEFQPYILGTRKKRNGQLRYSTGGEEKLADLVSGKTFGGKDKDSTDLPFFLILNIESLRYKKGKNYLITEELIRKINEGYIDMIAVDEIHKNVSPSSMQGTQLMKIKKSSARKIEWFPMTGTPIVSKPTDVFLPLRLIDGHYGNSFWSWCQQFCVYGGFGGHEIIGYKNIPYLKSLLEPNMLRRLKKDILDLPEKLPQTIYVDNTEYQQKLYNELEMALYADRDNVVKSLNPMTHFLRLRQVNGSPELIDPDITIDNNYLKKNAKAAVLIEMIQDIMENTNEKIIVFSNWVEPLRTLYRLITKRYKVCTYTGTMSADDRETHKQRFINDPECRIIIGTYGALGTSHTLTVANHVFFYDEHWTPADMKQASDRVDRPGQTNTVNLYHLITVDTVDERVHNLLYTKEGISEYIVDGTLDIHNHPEIFDLLLSRK